MKYLNYYNHYNNVCGFTPLDLVHSESNELSEKFIGLCQILMEKYNENVLFSIKFEDSPIGFKIPLHDCILQMLYVIANKSSCKEFNILNDDLYNFMYQIINNKHKYEFVTNLKEFKDRIPAKLEDFKKECLIKNILQ